MESGLKLERGRPADQEGRVPQETAVYDLLDRLRIDYERVDHEAAFTIEACAAVNQILSPAVICKNLFLCNRQKTKFYLLMLRHDKKFFTRDISGQLGVARLSFASEDFMMEYLHTSPGSVSVMGLMNDVRNQVQLLIDGDVLREEYLGCHPCINTSSIRFRTAYLTDVFLPAVHHDYIEVKVPAEDSTS